MDCLHQQAPAAVSNPPHLLPGLLSARRRAPFLNRGLAFQSSLWQVGACLPVCVRVLPACLSA